MENLFKLAALALKESSHVLITSGAGMSVDSGLPDYRGPEGFWREYPPLRHLGVKFQEMSTPHWFETDPELAWGFFGHRYLLYKDTTPHDGYQFLLDVANEKEDYFVVTSNTDGQFAKAGFDEDKIHEIHGCLHYLQSTINKPNEHGEIWNALESQELQNIELDMETCRATSKLPYCIDEESVIARPNVLMFGDWFYAWSRNNEQAENYRLFYHDICHNHEPDERKVVVIEVGAGKAIPTIRNKSDFIVSHQSVLKSEATLIRINIHDPDVPRVYEQYQNFISIPSGGLESLTLIKQEYERLK